LTQFRCFLAGSGGILYENFRENVADISFFRQEVLPLREKMTDMNNKIYDCIVAGGGISGVSFAYYLSRAARSILLIDDKTNAGGRIQTGQSVAYPGFRFEMGAHTCYNSYSNLIAIIRETGLRDLVQPFLRHGYTVYSQHKVKNLFSEISLLRMFPAGLKYFCTGKNGKTIREYFRPITGGEQYDRLFKHAFRAVICQPADDYPAEIFLKKRHTKDRTFPRKFGFKQGMYSFIDAVLKASGTEHIPSSEVVNIDRENDIFIIETGDGKHYLSRNVALAADPQTSSRLLKHTEPEVSLLLSTVSLFHSESLNVTVPKDRLKIRETAGIIALSDKFMSAVSRDLVRDERLRSFTFHFEKGKFKLPETMDLICNVLGIRNSDIAERKYSEHSLAARRLHNIDIERKMDGLLNGRHVYVTGNYFKGLSMEDCVTRSKREAERFITYNS
jgi:protoporphyrinogen oxidase